MLDPPFCKKQKHLFQKGAIFKLSGYSTILQRGWCQDLKHTVLGVISDQQFDHVPTIDCNWFRRSTKRYPRGLFAVIRRKTRRRNAATRKYRCPNNMTTVSYSSHTAADKPATTKRTADNNNNNNIRWDESTTRAKRQQAADGSDNTTILQMRHKKHRRQEMPSNI